jgi:hypothetical protein
MVQIGGAGGDSPSTWVRLDLVAECVKETVEKLISAENMTSWRL